MRKAFWFILSLLFASGFLFAEIFGVWFVGEAIVDKIERILAAICRFGF